MRPSEVVRRSADYLARHGVESPHATAEAPGPGPRAPGGGGAAGGRGGARPARARGALGGGGAGGGSTPPYLSEEEYRDLPPEVRAEPYEALVGGTGVHRRLVEAARE